MHKFVMTNPVLPSIKLTEFLAFTMERLVTILMIILCMKQFFRCVPHTKVVLDKNISKYKSNNGEPVAVEQLIQEYEREHVELLNNMVRKDYYLEQKTFENKDLNEYCRRYLHQCVPGRSSFEATGKKYISELRYTTLGYEYMKNIIIVVACTYQFKKKIQYYLTRSSETNCVYALERSVGSHRQLGIYRIIYKHCNFELHDYEKSKKRKSYSNRKICHGQFLRNCGYRKKVLKEGGHLHTRTGQIIANDESIKEYELEHQRMMDSETLDTDKPCPFMLPDSDLNECCHNYLQECVPNRYTVGAVGNWSLEKVEWRNNAGKSAQVIVVKCIIPDSSQRHYYFTKAQDKNCVFALLRAGRYLKSPFHIIFRHCYSSYLNNKQEILETSYILGSNYTLSHKKIKTEHLPDLETLQLFPYD